MNFLRRLFSFATLTLFVAISLSSIAAWYSIQGLIAIFSAAVIPIMIMGGSLEFAKVVTTVWLHKFWDKASLIMKMYLIPAVIALALLTSMGIFGFLSKAHSDQSLVSGDAQAKLAIYDEKIKTEKDNISAAKKALQQMDSQVDQMLGRTTDDKGTERAVQIRRQQSKERTSLQKDISDAQARITQLNEQRAPIAAENRKVEAEVGPIKYIAALIYGDNPSADLLERAVRWVIILIVFVFDPLALTLVLAASASYGWMDKKEQNKEPEPVEEVIEEPVIDEILEDDSKDNISIIEQEPVKEVEQILCHRCNTPLVNVPEIGPFCLNKECNSNINYWEESAEEPTQIEQLPTVDSEVPISKLEPTELKTEGVTLQETDAGYVQYEGKSVSKSALSGMRPDLFAAKPDTEPQNSTNFGTEFPLFAKKGNIFIRVDVLPNKVFKFDGNKWIEINKNTTDSYLYNEAYIRHLVDKIESGEYDIELLSEGEKVQIEEYLTRSPKL